MGEGLIWRQPKIRRNQEELTRIQIAYVEQFAREQMAARLSTESIDEKEAEQHLRAAYRAAGVRPPIIIRWFDSPYSFVQAHAPFYLWNRVKANKKISSEREVQASLYPHVGGSVITSVGATMWTEYTSAMASVEYNILESVEASVWANPWARLWIRWWIRWWTHLWTYDVRTGAETSMVTLVPYSAKKFLGKIIGSSLQTQSQVSSLAAYRFYHEVFEENKLIHLARFSEMVSGYRLGTWQAWVVRKPTVLKWDAQGRFHNASGPCIQYRDGWGVYAWHGLRIPKKLFMHPEQVTRKEWMQEPNAEVRRVIQELLGNERFIELIGGKQIDTGRRGKLIEIQLGPHDPERVAHYVQVQDSSTERHYYLRVPPSITSADEALAWTFGLNETEYQPGQET